MRALVLKELREVAGIAAAALAVYLAVVGGLMGIRAFRELPGVPSGSGVPFVEDRFQPAFALVTAALAAALGLRQTLGESIGGTWQFLLHRPRRRTALVLVKVATGLGVLLVSAAAPIVAYGVWAALPGRHASPFAWSMTGPAWDLAMLMTLVYLGAFLTGLRPGLWYGTRLLPLAGAGVLLGAAYLASWVVPAVLAAGAAGLVLVACVCHVARVRDYA